MHRVWGCASAGSNASGLGDKVPEAGEYLSNKYKNSIVSKNKRNSLWSFPNLWTKNNFAMEHQSPVNQTQCPASCTLWWWLDVMQCVSQSVFVSPDLFTYFRCYWNDHIWSKMAEGMFDLVKFFVSMNMVYLAVAGCLY